jgi:hypothetical protein
MGMTRINCNVYVAINPVPSKREEQLRGTSILFQKTKQFVLLLSLNCQESKKIHVILVFVFQM